MTNDWPASLLYASRVVVLSALALAVLIFFLQRWVAFPGALVRSPRTTPSPPEGVEQIWLETVAGRVEAWLFPAVGDGSRPLIIYAHGNGELIEDWSREMTDLAAHGVHALAVEFPGYGFSEGKPTRQTIRSTFGEAFDRMADRVDVDPDRIVAYGRSMGGGAAGDLAVDRPVAALILQSTFSSTMEVARSMLIPGLLVRDRFDNVAAVRAFDGPVLLLHGPDDEVLPFAHARRIAAARDGLEVTRIPCGHNDCAAVWPEIRDDLIRFLRVEDVLPNGGAPDVGAMRGR